MLYIIFVLLKKDLQKPNYIKQIQESLTKKEEKIIQKEKEIMDKEKK